MIVCGDIGHGGGDPGCVVNGVQEKDYQLPIGLAWREQLLREYQDVDVVLTRDTDRSVAPGFTGRRSDLWRELRARCDIANRNQAALLFSMHHNANANPNVRGGEIYVYGSPDWALATDSNHQAPNSYRMAQAMAPILEAFLAQFGIPFRGIRVAGFDVLEHTHGPAVLVEPFYITSPEDRDVALQPSFNHGLVETYVEMVATGLGIKRRSPGPFSDVPSDHWAADVLTDAQRMGIAAGRPDGSFGLGEPLKREEGAALAVRAYRAAIEHLTKGE